MGNAAGQLSNPFHLLSLSQTVLGLSLTVECLVQLTVLDFEIRDQDQCLLPACHRSQENGGHCCGCGQPDDQNCPWEDPGRQEHTESQGDAKDDNGEDAAIRTKRAGSRHHEHRLLMRMPESLDRRH